MKSDLIVMLTYNDTTVEEAYGIFSEMKESPVKYWGFKDVGLPPAQIVKLVEALKKAGKCVKLEVVTVTEKAGMAAAKLCVDCGIDVLMGTVFFDSIHDYLKDKQVKYAPFVGKVHGHPSILDGSIDEIVDHAQELEAKGVDGLDLLTYRYTGDADRLLKEVVGATGLRVVSAGSIDSFDRVASVCDSGAWGFTIGSAFFDKKFSPQGSFKKNVMDVVEWVENYES